MISRVSCPIHFEKWQCPLWVDIVEKSVWRLHIVAAEQWVERAPALWCCRVYAIRPGSESATPSLPAFALNTQGPPRDCCKPATLTPARMFARARHWGRKRVHDEIMSEIVAKRLVEHLERAGFVVMKRRPIGGGAALGRGFEG